MEWLATIEHTSGERYALRFTAPGFREAVATVTREAEERADTAGEISRMILARKKSENRYLIP